MRTPIVAFAIFALLTPSTSAERPSEAGPSWTYSAEADHLLFEARKIIDWKYDGPLPRGQGARIETPVYNTYRLFGDGRLAIETSQYVWNDLPKLNPEAIAQLLRITDRLVDLPAAQTFDSPPEHGAYVAVHLDRYISADWQDAVDYLDAVVTDPPEALFSELAALHQWLWRLGGEGIWFSVNPQPPICHPQERSEHGLEDLPSTWCDWLMSHHNPARLEDTDSEARERIRERLRQRLRELPRGSRADDEP